jgi:hypothetical protein
MTSRPRRGCWFYGSANPKERFFDAESTRFDAQEIVFQRRKARLSLEGEI